MSPCVKYLGNCIDVQGLHPTSDKVEAIQKAPTPKNLTQLRAYLGLLNYYNRFLPNLSSELAPLYKLLRKNSSWHWGFQQDSAFEKSEQLLLSSQLLVHFDPFVSRTLASAEINYSQIEKEALSCVFGITRFHSYLYGHFFTLITDHKPLLSLFKEHKAVPSQVSGRIQRWALTLAAYEYSIAFCPTAAHSNADALSQLHFHLMYQQCQKLYY